MPDSGLGTGKHLRVSGQMQIIEYNRESDDATLPDLSPQGVASSTGLPTGVWECLEYHLSSDGTIETWLNGNLIPGLTVGPGHTNPNSNGWGSSYKPNIQGVYFGWESYSGSVDTFWYDDVAIASSRIGCSASGVTTTVSTTKSTPTTTKSTKSTKQTTSTKRTRTTTKQQSTTVQTTTTQQTTPTTTASSTPTGSCSPKYGQCGGQGWTGPTCCQSGSTCNSYGQYYSQCI